MVVGGREISEQPSLKWNSLQSGQFSARHPDSKRQPATFDQIAVNFDHVHMSTPWELYG
jgi:hypothetical protein